MQALWQTTKRLGHRRRSAAEEADRAAQAELEQATAAAIRAEQERRQYRFKVTEVAGAVEKNARIRRLIPWFEGGRIWFPQSLPYTDIQGHESDLVEDLIEIEYATFPVGRFDDGMDCLARLAEPTLTLPWPDEEDDIPPGAQIAWQVMDEVAGW